MMKPLPLSNTLHYRTTKSVSPEDLYADRDPEALGEHFMRHLDRMTVEGLHSKSDIACELAHRDTEIAALQVEVARLTSCLERANSQTEEFERKWYLSCDEVEALRAEREPTPSVEAAHEMGATGAPATREECAKVVEQDLYPDDSQKPYTQHYNSCIKRLADKIRSGT